MSFVLDGFVIEGSTLEQASLKATSVKDHALEKNSLAIFASILVHLLLALLLFFMSGINR